MGDLLISLVPTALAGAIAPVLILPVLFLLGTRHPIRNASAFTVAALAAYATLGAVAVFMVGERGVALGAGFSKISAIVSLVLGGLMLLMIPLQMRSAANNNAALNKHVQALGASGAGRAFGLGVMMPFFGAKNLIVYVACLTVIVNGQVGVASSLIAMLAVLLIFSIQMLIPIAIYAAVSERAARALAATQSWVLKHNRTIGFWISLVLGLFLLWKGFTDLWLAR